MCGAHAVPVGEASGLREIERLAAEPAAPAARPGALRSADVRAAYVEHLLAVGAERPALHAALDCGNGMAGVGLEPLLERLPLRAERLYFEPDGRFPNHPADPLHAENLADLQREVRRSGADFGAAFDGDGDRAIFVDERAEPVPADLMTALLARSQLRRHPGGRVLYDLRSSRAVPEEIRAAGGVAEMCRVGHSFVKAQMRETGAIFAGELSGHFYFRFSDTLVADDGSAALMALLDVLGRERRPALGADRAAPPLRDERRDQPPRARSAGADRRHRGRAPRQGARSRTSTGCWSSTRTGGSTCGPRTPSPCCA